MSAFLGPIHYWLYAKIQHVQNRTAKLAQAAAADCSTLADNCLASVYETYGEPTAPEKDLSELIDPTNIHGWLSTQIQRTEAREAALLKELSEYCGDTAWELAAGVFAEDGAQLGTAAAKTDRYELETAIGLYRAFHDTFLSGMPCDGGFEEVLSTADKIVLERSSCPKPALWQQIGVPAEAMQKLYQTWLGAFIKSLNPAFGVNQNAHNGKQQLTISKK